MASFPKIKLSEPHRNGAWLRDVILGGQDGLVNVLGLILGVATALPNAHIVIISGLAATFAESISMAAVAYTSSRAVKDVYDAEFAREVKEVKEIPAAEREEIREIYRRKGFKGKDLEKIVKVICSNKKVWLDTMMSEELHLYKDDYSNPKKTAAVVGFSSLVGSVVPLAPFFFLPVQMAVIYALVLSTVVLFALGFAKAKLTIGSPMRSGFEVAVIGMVAAIGQIIVI